jgi:hypothetical protein
MKKQLLCVLIGAGLGVNTWAASAEQYVAMVEKVTDQYKQERRQFFLTLDPNLQQFTAQQNQRYCGIVKNYVEGLYLAADENKAYLDREYRQIVYSDVVKQVMESKDMQLLTRYGVQCDMEKRN